MQEKVVVTPSLDLSKKAQDGKQKLSPKSEVNWWMPQAEMEM